MKSFALLAAYLIVFLNLSVVQNKPAPLQPTKLEAFAVGSTAQVKWSKEIGRIEESGTYAVVTALIIEDVAQSPSRMRGIRIDLSNEKVRDQIYLEESRLERVKKALLEIESGIESFRKERSPTPHRYYGAEEFWRPYERLHTLNAAYYIRPDSSGLSLSAYNNQEFRFPGHRPVELSEILSRAIRDLEQQP